MMIENEDADPKAETMKCVGVVSMVAYADNTRIQSPFLLGLPAAELLGKGEEHYAAIIPQVCDERDSLEARLLGANERCRLLFDAKNRWAERARKAVAVVDAARPLMDELRKPHYPSVKGAANLGTALAALDTKERP